MRSIKKIMIKEALFYIITLGYSATYIYMFFDDEFHENHSSLLILGSVLLVAFVFFRNYKEHSKSFKVGAYIIISSLFIQFILDITSIHEMLFQYEVIHMLVHILFGVTYFFFALGVYRESFQYKKIENVSRLTLNFDEVVIFEYDQIKKIISMSVSQSIKKRYNLDYQEINLNLEEFKSWVVDEDKHIISFLENETQFPDKTNIIIHLKFHNQNPIIAVQIKGFYTIGNRVFSIGFDHSHIEQLNKQKDQELIHKLNLIQEMQLGFAEHEMIYDKTGKAIDYRYLYVNEVFCELTGWKKADIEGKLVSEIYPNVDESRIERYQTLFENSKSLVFNSYFEKQNAWYELKAYRSDENKFVTLFLDITQIKEINRNLEYLNTHNPLTNHLNYEGLLRLSNHYRINNRALCFYATLSDYEEYRAFYGYKIANLILKSIGKEFDRYQKKSNIVCHTLENQFILILIDPSEEDYKNVFLHAQESLSRKVVINQASLNIRQNIGYSETDKQIDLIELVNQAGISNSYAAKEEHILLKKYSSSMSENLESNINMARRLQLAIDEKIIDVYFQKIIDSRDNNVCFIEALARWTDPEMGKVSPDRFINFAINSKLVDSLDDYLLDKTLDYFSIYLKKDKSNTKLSLNITSSALFRIGYLTNLVNKIRDYKINPEQIAIEISENTFVRDKEECIKRINAYKKAGFLIAIDDFGSEYSSLSILDNIPFDILKLDGIFSVKSKAETLNQIALTVSRIVNKQNRILVVEQIETKDQADLFKDMSCFVHQGYYYHKPEKLI